MSSITLLSLQFTYFPIIGRGEAVRLALTYKGVDFEDDRVMMGDWGAKKPAMVWNSLPNLTLKSGETFGQSRSVTRFVAKKTGLYPTDDVLAAYVDDLLDAGDDLLTKTNSTGQGKEIDEKIKLRKESVEAGGLKSHLTNLDNYIGKVGSGGNAVGSSITIADFYIFSALNQIVCGFYDGMTPDMLVPYKNLQAVRGRVGSLPEVVAWYDKQKEMEYWKGVGKFYQVCLDSKGL